MWDYGSHNNRVMISGKCLMPPGFRRKHVTPACRACGSMLGSRVSITMGVVGSLARTARVRASPSSSGSAWLVIIRSAPTCSYAVSAFCPSSTADISSERRIALVIGNSNYLGAPTLTNPGRDAAAVGAALRSLGFKNVRLATDLSREKLTKSAIEVGQPQAPAGEDYIAKYRSIQVPGPRPHYQ